MNFINFLILFLSILYKGLSQITVKKCLHPSYNEKYLDKSSNNKNILTKKLCLHKKSLKNLIDKEKNKSICKTITQIFSIK